MVQLVCGLLWWLSENFTTSTQISESALIPHITESFDSGFGKNRFDCLRISEANAALQAESMINRLRREGCLRVDDNILACFCLTSRGLALSSATLRAISRATAAKHLAGLLRRVPDISDDPLTCQDSGCNDARRGVAFLGMSLESASLTVLIRAMNHINPAYPGADWNLGLTLARQGNVAGARGGNS